MSLSRFDCAILLALSLSMASPARASNLWFAPDDEPLPAEDQKRIRDLVRESAAASAKDDWERARTALLRAWEIKSLPMIAANLGYVEVKLGLYRDAAQHLKFFLDNAPAGHAERRADAERQFVECQKHIAVVSVTTNVPGAQVSMDATDIGLTPMEKKFFVEPGTHSFRVSHSGYQSELRTVSVDADKEVILQFVLHAELAASAPPPHVASSTSTERGRPGVQSRTWVLVGASAATAIGLGFGIGYRIRASSLNRDAESTLAQIDHLPDTTMAQISSNSECLNRTGSARVLCEQLWSKNKSQDSATNVSTVAFVTAGVFGVATVAAYFLWPDTKRPLKTQSTAAGIRLVPLSIERAQGLEVSVAF